uniref:Uncharacterized protein n=1 Tax=Vespula pensylvanica TaxID=30213 RepID=A0A834P7N7_VESPE|nr:hypothetical protein H0235_004714 [Vespula pensylvanica]
MEPAASSAINTPARERYDETHGRKGPVATVAVAVAVASLESPFEDSSVENRDGLFTFAHAQRFMAKVLAWCLAMEKKAEAASTFEELVPLNTPQGGRTIYFATSKGAHLNEGFYKIVVTSPVAKLCWEQEVRPLHERPARNFNQTFK